MDNSTQEKKREGFFGQKMVVVPQNIRKSIKNNKIISSLFLTDIGYYPNAKNHFRKRENGATEYILIYCVEGHGSIKINSTTHSLTPNSYFIIPALTNIGLTNKIPGVYTGYILPVRQQRICLENTAEKILRKVTD